MKYLQRISVSLVCGVIFGCMFACQSPGDKSAIRPNIILIMADDISPRWFSIYGEQENVYTPHIDQLGNEGVCFRTAWATPMCSPTRALIMTGQYGMHNGWLHNSLKIPDSNGNIDFLKRGTRTFAGLVKNAGYRTAICARWGIPVSWELGSLDFDEYCMQISNKGLLPEGVEIQELRLKSKSDEMVLEDQFEVIVSLDPEKYNGKKEASFRLESEKGYGNTPLFSRYWHPAIVQNGKLLLTEPEDFATDFYVDFIIDFMDRSAKQPSLVYFPLHLPHGTSAKTGKKLSKVPTSPASGRPGKNYGGNMKEATGYIDAVIGNIVAGLKDKGLLENTLIIFTGDNGDAGGPATVRPGKGKATDNGARVPFIAWGPGIVKQRGLTDELCDLSDILPTLVDYAGANLPEGQVFDGASLRPFLSGVSDSHREWIFSYIATSRMIRNKRYLIEAADPEFGAAQGRFYDCGDNRSGFDYLEITDLSGDDKIAAERLYELLDSLPQVDYSIEPAKGALMEYRKNGQWKHSLENR